jgi:hypothetical protein
MGLLGDYADCVGPQIKDVLLSNMGWIEQFIIKMRGMQDQECQEAANWAYKQIKVAIN